MEKARVEYEEMVTKERTALEKKEKELKKLDGELRGKGMRITMCDQQLDEDKETFAKEMKTILMAGVLVARLGVKVVVVVLLLFNIVYNIIYIG